MRKITYKSELPFLLQHIPDPPRELYIEGSLPEAETKLLCVVGARECSSYGIRACKQLIAGLQGYNICIVSGMARGIDQTAHWAAMDAGLKTIAFPGSGLDSSVLYPHSSAYLAEEILKADGALISEHGPYIKSAPWMFPRRNRLMAGISHATLVIEAELLSGTLITSRLATDYNRDVGAVPGDIFSLLSAGPHMLIQNGATPVTCSDDILRMLGLKAREDGPMIGMTKPLPLYLGEYEKKIGELLKREPLTSNEIIEKSEFDTKIVNEALSTLEIEGLIKESGGKFIICL